MSSATRPAIAVLLPDAERDHVALELHNGGFDPIFVRNARELSDVLVARRDVALAIIDVESDAEMANDAWAALHAGGRNIPALLIVDDRSLDQLDMTAPGHEDDEYLTRPYSAESIRWRVEAMCIRSAAVDDGSGPVLQGDVDQADWGRRGQVIAVFNPKGGVGKTMIATNLARLAGQPAAAGPADRCRHRDRARARVPRHGRRSDGRRRTGGTSWRADRS